MNDKSDTSYDPDECPKTNYMERLLDEADYRRDERKDREIEAAMHRVDNRIDKNGRNQTCECGAISVWSKRWDMWVCSDDLTRYKALYGKHLEI